MSDEDLPSELQHDTIHLYRDMSHGSAWEPRAFQIVFDQSWLPFEYEIPDGWTVIHTRVEYHNTGESVFASLLGLLGHEQTCITLVVTEDVDVRERMNAHLTREESSA